MESCKALGCANLEFLTEIVPSHDYHLEREENYMMEAIYRRLDCSKNEIRLLKIFPPGSPSATTDHEPLSFSTDAIHCELQYESLDDIHSRKSKRDISLSNFLDYCLQDIPGMSDTETDIGAQMNSLKRELGKLLLVDRDTNYEMSPKRREALRALYQLSEETMKEWLPKGLEVPPSSFKSWLDTWIWTPLSGDEHHLEETTLGYFALSYVWREQSTDTLGGRYKKLDKLVTASGSSPRQLLKAAGQSFDFLEKVFGSKEEVVANTTMITLNGKPVLVGNNLEKALRALRELPEVQNGTRIWVDGLCINQDDIYEKNIEVKRMGDIFGNAERVISWLGDEADHSGQTLEFMNSLGEILKRQDTVAPIMRSFLRHIHTDVAICLTKLLLRSYWNRIWIVQEIALGGEKSIAICGARRFPWPNLLRCGKMLKTGFGDALLNYKLKLDQSTESETALTVDDLKDGITKLTTLYDAKIDCRDADRTVPLSSTIWFRIPSSNNATDTRDLVYGMMNILPQKLTALISVDYSQCNTFVDVMANFAAAHIQSTHSLHWILHRPYAPFLGYKEWPTWVPNLALPFSSAHWGWAVFRGSNAWPGTQSTASFYTDAASGKHLLSCKGFRLNIVNQATQSCNMVNLDHLKKLLSRTGGNYAMFEEVKGMLLNASTSFIPDTKPETAPTLSPILSTHKYNDLNGLKIALMECFRCLGLTYESEDHTVFDIPLDIDDDNINEPELHLSSFVPFQKKTAINSIRAVFADFNLWGQTFKDLFPPRLSDVDPTSFSLPTINDRTFIFGRLFTVCSGYIGTCICNVRPGDEVFLLQGCYMPVILRRSDAYADIYELQGGVYIPGVMKGEVFTKFQHLGSSVETITIC